MVTSQLELPWNHTRSWRWSWEQAAAHPVLSFWKDQFPVSDLLLPWNSYAEVNTTILHNSRFSVTKVAAQITTKTFSMTIHKKITSFWLPRDFPRFPAAGLSAPTSLRSSCLKEFWCTDQESTCTKHSPKRPDTKQQVLHAINIAHPHEITKSLNRL